MKASFLFFSGINGCLSFPTGMMASFSFFSGIERCFSFFSGNEGRLSSFSGNQKAKGHALARAAVSEGGLLGVPSSEPYEDVEPVARFLSIPKSNVLNWCRSYPDFPCLKLPGTYRVRTAEVLVPFFWPVKLPGPDGRQMAWHTSAANAAERAMKRRIRITANMDCSAFRRKPVVPREEMQPLINIFGSNEAYVSAADLATAFRIRPETISDWASRYRDFPALRLPGLLRMRPSEVERWLGRFQSAPKARFGDVSPPLSLATKWEFVVFSCAFRLEYSA